MLIVFKLVSCKPGASRELDLRPPRPEMRRSKCSKLIFGNKIIYCYRDTFYFLCFFDILEV